MKLNRRNRRRPKKRELNLPKIEIDIDINWSRVVSMLAAVAVVGATYVSTLWLMDRPIESVVINGEFQRVTPMQLEEVLAPHLRTGFLSADLKRMQADLVDAPWVARADVRRRWPGTIDVRIEEERAVARWGESGLLNVDGRLFVDAATHVPAELPTP